MTRRNVTGRFLRASATGLLLSLALSSISCQVGTTADKVGQLAPDFEFQPIGGEPQLLSELRGRPVIVNFFGTRCGPCRLELPELDRTIARPYSDRGLVVLVFGVDRSPDDVVEFKKSSDYSFLVATDPKSEVFSRFTDQEMIPQTFLIKPDGTIAMHLVGYTSSELMQLKRQVEKLLPASK